MTTIRDRQDERKPAPECFCNHGWVCEEHPDKPWDHDNCGGAGQPCKNPDCRKDPDTIFAAVHGCSHND